MPGIKNYQLTIGVGVLYSEAQICGDRLVKLWCCEEEIADDVTSSFAIAFAGYAPFLYSRPFCSQFLAMVPCLLAAMVTLLLHCSLFSFVFFTH
jgi:hypothetical protein